MLEESELVSFDDAQVMKLEFRSINEGLSQYPDIQQAVLDGLDDIEGAAKESGATGSDVEWVNTCDVVGRRIRKAMQPPLR